MKKQLLGLGIAALMFGGVVTANATPTTLVTAGGEWNYATLGFDLYTDWTNVEYNDFDWINATYSEGDAAFGNSYRVDSGTSLTPYSTYWAANTDLALQTQIDLTGNLIGDLTLNVASDNGFILFVNGQEVAKSIAEGWTYNWEYNFNISNSYFNTGTNVVSVFAEDHGGLTYFDMELTADVAPVPEPATMLLFGTGLVGLVGSRLRKKKK